MDDLRTSEVLVDPRLREKLALRLYEENKDNEEGRYHVVAPQLRAGALENKKEGTTMICCLYLSHIYRKEGDLNFYTNDEAARLLNIAVSDSNYADIDEVEQRHQKLVTSTPHAHDWKPEQHFQDFMGDTKVGYVTYYCECGEKLEEKDLEKV